MKLTATLVDVADITPQTRDEMFVLMDGHYSNLQRSLFEADLAEKQWVILVRDPGTHRLCGFSTQTLLDATVHGKPIKVLFSGDTIIHRQYWGDQALTHIWGRFALSFIDTHNSVSLYWFLISQGYKTYRFLPVFFREFYPRHNTETPAEIRDIIDTLAIRRYREDYDATHGVIRSTPMQYRLRTGLADVTPERMRDPHISFFQECNPGHARGDELCCLAPLTRANFTRAAYRVIGSESVALELS